MSSLRRNTEPEGIAIDNDIPHAVDDSIEINVRKIWSDFLAHEDEMKKMVSEANRPLASRFFRKAA